MASSPNAESEALNSLYKTGDMEQDGEELTFNPYNPENVEITEADVRTILTRFGLPPRVHNFELYRRAFIHRSYVKRPELENEVLNVKLADKPGGCLKLSTKSNERLEFLGDGVLELVVKYYLYRRFPKEDEGFMTEKKIALVKNEHIGKLSLAMGLNKWFIISRHAEERNTRTNLKKLGCLLKHLLVPYSLTTTNTVYQARLMSSHLLLMKMICMYPTPSSQGTDSTMHRSLLRPF